MVDYCVSFQKNDKVLTRVVEAKDWKDAYLKVFAYYGAPILIFYIRRAHQMVPEWDPLGRYEPDDRISIISKEDD
jgi:hypothetical protein